MARKLKGGAIQANTITTTQLTTTVVTQISAGGGPKVKSLIYPGNDLAANSTGGQTVYLTGSGFAANAQVLVNGAAVPSQSFISASNISFSTPALSTGTYAVYVINPEDGGTAILYPGLLISGEPTWVSASPLADVDIAGSWNITLSASGDTPITYALAAGNTLPSGISLSANGLISGTLSSPPGSDTTYTFSVIATDAQNQDSTKQFSITATANDVYFANNVLLIHANGTNNQNNHAFLDSSNNNFTITRNGNATQGSFSPFSQTGWSNYFDGSGDYLDVANNVAFNFGTGNFTIEFWAYFTSISGSTPNLIDMRSGSMSQTALTVYLNAGTLTLYVNGANRITGSSLAANIWYHIALVRNSGSTILYVNGAQSGSTYSDSNNYGAQPIRIFASNDGSTVVAQAGYCSNLRVVKGTAVYTSAFTPPTSPLTAVANTTLLTCNSNRFNIDDGETFSIVNAKIYSTYGGGTRSNNYTVQYSSDNVSWTNAFSGIMESNACGIFTGIGGGGSYGSYKYWRYLVGTAVTQHHPRVSRIMLTSASGVDYTLITYVNDNCSDSGTIPTNGDSFILSGVPAVTRNGDVSVQAFSPFAPTAAYTTANVGGSGYFDGTGDYLSVADNTALDMGSSNFTIEGWYFPLGNTTNYPALFSKRADGNVVGGVLVYFAATPTLTPSLLVDIGGSWAINTQSSIPFIANQWNHFAVVRNGSSFNLYINGVSGVSATNSGTIPDNSSAFVIGAMGANGATPINSCYISNFRIIKGTAVYTSAFTPPTVPLTNIANTSLLCNFTNAGIFDQTAKNVLETVGDAKVSTAQYKYGTASMYFDGTGDYIMPISNQNLVLGTGDFTIECWVYPTSVSSGTYAIVSNRFTGGGNSVFICGYGTTNGLYLHTQDTAVMGTSQNLTLNTWQHVAFVRNGGTLKIYLNGTSYGTSTSFTSNLSATNSPLIGQDGTRSSPASNYVGYIDDLRITKGYARYTTNFTPPASAFKDK